MSKRLFFIVVIFTQNIGFLLAQWSEKDSIWLENILSGKEELRLNPEVKKAIESGTFFDIEKHTPELLSSPSQLPLLKYFEGIAVPDTAIKKTDYSQLPPSVFMLSCMPDSILGEQLQSFYISPQEREYLRSLLPGAATFNAENLMRYVFWKSHRAKVRNRKKATAWKWYNQD